MPEHHCTAASRIRTLCQSTRSTGALSDSPIRSTGHTATQIMSLACVGGGESHRSFGPPHGHDNLAHLPERMCQHSNHTKIRQRSCGGAGSTGLSALSTSSIITYTFSPQSCALDRQNSGGSWPQRPQGGVKPASNSFPACTDGAVPVDVLVLPIEGARSHVHAISTGGVVVFMWISARPARRRPVARLRALPRARSHARSCLQLGHRARGCACVVLSSILNYQVKLFVGI